MKKFTLELVTPEHVISHDDVLEITLPTRAGEIGILARHVPIVSLLKPGEMRIKKEHADVFMAVGQGFIEVRDSGEVIILTDMADLAEDIDIEQARVARTRAEQLLEEKKDSDDADFAQFESLFERELARYRVATKYSRK